MQTFPLGLVVEGSVAVLLAMTIAYCVVLNGRLKRLHADRDVLKQMINDLVQATRLANSAIKGLKETAVEADAVLAGRLDEAERFSVQLANHINSGQALMARIERLTTAGRTKGEKAAEIVPAIEDAAGLRSALDQLASRPRIRGNAA